MSVGAGWCDVMENFLASKQAAIRELDLIERPGRKEGQERPTPVLGCRTNIELCKNIHDSKTDN